MRPTRRCWGVIALAAVTAAYAAVLARPLALGGTVLVGAWLLARQYHFRRALESTVDGLSIGQVPARTAARTGGRLPVTLSAALAAPARLPGDVTVRVEAGVPTAATVDEPIAVSLAASRPAADRTAAVEWPVAGRHRFRPASVTVADDLFRETVPAGDRPTVTVEPRGPRSIHVGEGGDRVAMAFGEHDAGRVGTGIEPAELRAYEAGDTLKQIDWKATARLGTPHVRDYEAETDRRTLLVVDRRASLGTGPTAETKLDYLREVALAIAGSARRLGDPTGLVAVGDEGITDRVPAGTGPDAYARIRRTVLEATPTADRAAATVGEGALGSGAGASGTAPRTTAADARRSLAALDGDDAFARTLAPFYADRRSYIERVESDPLPTAVRTALAREGGRVWAVLFTDDARPTELRETVAYARSAGASVLVALAPTVLYEPGGLADVERAYERYAEFERLRRDLQRTPDVTALEVGPADRLAAVLGGRSAGGERA